MKRKLIITTLAVCLVAVGSLSVKAQYGIGGGCGQAGGGGYDCEQNGWGGQYRQDRQDTAAELIGLSEEQQNKIEAIRTAAREENVALRDKMRGYRDQIAKLTDAGNFDEKAIRAIAAAEAEIRIEMAVTRAETHSKMLAVMTPEQQEIAQKLRAFGQEGRQGRGGRFGRGGCANQI